MRDIPALPWNRVFATALVLFVAMVAGWELYWRDFGVVPSYRNSDGQWAEQRRRLDHGEGNKTVLIGASRMLFDIQLPVWERVTGQRPIQLAMEGTSPVPILEDLAADPDFTGRVVVDVTPHVFFANQAYRDQLLTYARKQTPAQYVGDWLSMTFLEPNVAFYDPDFALGTIVQRQDWPAVLADRKGGAHFLLIPTGTVAGMESPELLEPGTPNYFAAVWAARDLVAGAAGHGHAGKEEGDDRCADRARRRGDHDVAPARREGPVPASPRISSVLRHALANDSLSKGEISRPGNSPNECDT